MKAEGAKAVAWATMSAKDTSFMLTVATYFKEKLIKKICVLKVKEKH